VTKFGVQPTTRRTRFCVRRYWVTLDHGPVLIWLREHPGPEAWLPLAYVSNAVAKCITLYASAHHSATHLILFNPRTVIWVSPR